MTHNIFNLLQTLEHLLLFVYSFGSITVSTDEMNPKNMLLKIKPDIAMSFYAEEYDSYENSIRNNFVNQSIQENIIKGRPNITSDIIWPNGKTKLVTLAHDDFKHMRYRHHHELSVKRKKLRSVDEFPITNHHSRGSTPLMHWVNISNQCFNFNTTYIGKVVGLGLLPTGIRWNTYGQGPLRYFVFFFNTLHSLHTAAQELV